ncbi:endonuclease/exonuclease/phosphatase family protein [Mesobacterium sp. TK19101]|uniref:Endonuclease/exonuclease/phosphatase family protein n=1 Tax=Mesobacterium hydrothermale TaxID=3111907 RepID=A0ABU6HHX0_9RHOB|nr:endonuclease/exonuclease/phosphatase family protein [Mesobacterium sp. TK19101]MEC3860735.1 endonuclease/exonuclease/phosphatase family protein [Mesobacterium sp. TK19101]
MLLRDLLNRDDSLSASVQTIVMRHPDVLVLTDIDFDHDRAALRALAAWLAEAGHPLPHVFALRPNTGLPTGIDLDGDGRDDGPRDAQGYGRFSGQGGMAVLSRWPIDEDRVTDLSTLLWDALPGSAMPADDPGRAVQRLSSTGHWIVPIQSDPPIAVLAFHATPPVFDGPEDRNGRRNADEARLWSLVLDGAFGPPPDRIVIAGNANLDPDRGEGRKGPLRALLTDPRLQDPVPQGPHGAITANWQKAPGPLRVSYVLPWAGCRVTGAGVDWPPNGSAVHGLAWVDLNP